MKRRGTLHTGLRRRTPLAAKTGLARTGSPQRTAPTPGERQVRLGVGVRKPLAARRKDTIPRKVRQLVLERDGYACVCCGKSVIGQRYSLGHRLRASQGGKAVPSNLLTLLGWGGQECHGRIDNREDPHDEAKGYTVRSGTDPALVPVMVSGEQGGVTVWLDDAGNYTDALGNAVSVALVWTVIAAGWPSGWQASGSWLSALIAVIALWWHRKRPDRAIRSWGAKSRARIAALVRQMPQPRVPVPAGAS